MGPYVTTPGIFINISGLLEQRSPILSLHTFCATPGQRVQVKARFKGRLGTKFITSLVDSSRQNFEENWLVLFGMRDFFFLIRALSLLPSGSFLSLKEERNSLGFLQLVIRNK